MERKMKKYIRQPWNKKYNHEICVCGHIRIHHFEIVNDNGACKIDGCNCMEFKKKIEEK